MRILKFVSGLIFFIIALHIFDAASAQTLSGKVIDIDNQPIPYVTVYFSELQTGTVTNTEGYYKIKARTGNQRVEFRCIGYITSVRNIDIQNNTTLDIQLQPATYQLSEIKIGGNNEDFAYSIMRKAIVMAPYYRQRVMSYNSEVYQRGTMIIVNIPRLIANTITVNDKKLKLKDGDTFISESINKVSYTYPNTLKQKVVSIKNTLPEALKDGMEPLPYMNNSLYDMEKNSDIISPLSSKAFSYYKFRYLGSLTDGNNTVHKIKVIPKVESAMVFKGTLFIVGDLWCVHSCDLNLEIEYGTVVMKQNYAAVNDDVWLPISSIQKMEGGFMGVEIKMAYMASVKYTDLKLNQSIQPTIHRNKGNEADINSSKTLTNKEMKKNVKQQNKQILKNQTQNQKKSYEVKSEAPQIEVEKDAVVEDSAFWNNKRLVPLTPKELEQIQINDSMLQLQFTDTIKTEKKEKKIKKLNFLLIEKRWRSKDSATVLYTRGLLTASHYDLNVVDGFVVKQSFKIEHKIDTLKSVHFEPFVGYAFARKALMWNATLRYNYAPMRRANFAIKAGNESHDFDNTYHLPPIANIIRTLFCEQNRIKYYQRQYVEIKNHIDIANGFQWIFSASYSENNTLTNHSDFTLYDWENQAFVPNVPSNNDYIPQDNFKSFVMKSEWQYTPAQYYRIWRNRKIMLHSKYPTFTVGIQWATPKIFATHADFLHLYGSIHQRFSFDMFKSFDYKVAGGYFPNSKLLHFSDFKHFRVNPVMTRPGEPSNQFHVLNFYETATTLPYFEAMFHYETNVLLLKFLPYLKKQLWSENLYANFQKISKQQLHSELGYSLNNVFFVFNVGTFVAFNNLDYNSVFIRLMYNF